MKQYLENVLIQQKGFSNEIKEKNSVKKLIKKYFPEEDCFTMNPVENESYFTEPVNAIQWQNQLGIPYSIQNTEEQYVKED